MPGSPDLRLIVITDAAIAAPRQVLEVVHAALGAGAPAVQLRMKDPTSTDGAGAARDLIAARDVIAAALELRQATRDAGALLFVNDRLDVALAAEADGVHLGPDDIPVAAARAVVPDDFLIGASTDDPELARKAARDGADYIGCGAVFGTTSKDVAGEAIGAARLDAVARAVDIPVIGIGGITVDNVARLADTAAAGVAVIGAVMGAPDPAAAVRTLLARRPSRS